MASEVYAETMRGNPNHVSKAICFAIITILAAGCSKHEEPVTHTPPATIFTLGPAANSAFRSFPGEVAASRNGRLSFDVPGRLIEFPVYDGMIVQEGGLIGRLDASDFVAQVDSARARFDAARDEFNRQVTLRNRNVIAQNELDRQREAFNVAEAGLRTAQKALDDTQLLAPFKGRVSHRFVRNFQSVQARELIVLLQDVSTLEIDIQLPENLMSGLNRNATVAEIQPQIEAKAEFAALPGQSFDLTLFSFSTRASAASRTFLVSFVFNPPDDSNILPGMTSTVRLRFKDQAAAAPEGPATYSVPVQAVLSSEGKSWVWRWDEKTGKVSRVSVELVGPAGDSMQIRSDSLKDGDELVSSGVRLLSEGMQVRRLETLKP
jgi:RND family efflux transporter MFP subunit